jgi:hypothetical protein
MKCIAIPAMKNAGVTFDPDHFVVLLQVLHTQAAYSSMA